MNWYTWCGYTYIYKEVESDILRGLVLFTQETYKENSYYARILWDSVDNAK